MSKMSFVPFELADGGTAGIHAYEIAAILPHVEEKATKLKVVDKDTGPLSYVYATPFPTGLCVRGDSCALVMLVEAYLMEDEDEEEEEECEEE